MLTGFQKKKIKKLFELYDQNSDGVLQKDDFTQIAENFVELGLCERDSDEHIDVQFVISGLWSSLHALTDENSDGTITQEEFMASFDYLLERREQFLPAWLNAAEVTLRLNDLNRDGILQRDEVIANMRAFHMSKEEAEEVFPRLDRDGDGTISILEWKQSIEEFFFSQDPDAPGNWFAGKLR